MSGWNLLVAGIAPDHVPALFAALLLPVLVLGYRWRGGRPPVPVEDRVAAWLMGLAALVHLALPLGHRDEPGLASAFLGDGAAFGWLASRAAAGRRWRRYAAPLVLATLVGYLVVLGTGGEEPDQVGIATAMVELAVLGLCLVPPAGPGPRRGSSAPPEPGSACAPLGRRRRVARVFGGAGLVAFTVLFGAITWGLSFIAHAAPDDAHDGGHGAHGEHAARAQAGVLMLPVSGDPSAEQRRAAADLAARTRTSLARYADVRAALAAGYRPTLARTGLSVHLESKVAEGDGRILDPDRPEMLMYAIVDGRATLLSAVYTMPRAGQAGPAPGGPLTRWHAHNGCLSLLPPGFSVVDAYGGCPALSVQVTLPVMMHVWVVDNPGGPYADQVPDAWTRAFNFDHGVPFHW